MLIYAFIVVAALRTPDMVSYLAAVFRGERPTGMQTFHAIVWTAVVLYLFT